MEKGNTMHCGDNLSDLAEGGRIMMNIFDRHMRRRLIDGARFSLRWAGYPGCQWHLWGTAGESGYEPMVVFSCPHEEATQQKAPGAYRVRLFTHHDLYVDDTDGLQVLWTQCIARLKTMAQSGDVAQSMLEHDGWQAHLELHGPPGSWNMDMLETMATPMTHPSDETPLVHIQFETKSSKPVLHLAEQPLLLVDSVEIEPLPNGASVVSATYAYPNYYQNNETDAPSTRQIIVACHPALENIHTPTQVDRIFPYKVGNNTLCFKALAEGVCVICQELGDDEADASALNEQKNWLVCWPCCSSYRKESVLMHITCLRQYATAKLQYGSRGAVVYDAFVHEHEPDDHQKNNAADTLFEMKYPPIYHNALYESHNRNTNVRLLCPLNRREESVTVPELMETAFVQLAPAYTQMALEAIAMATTNLARNPVAVNSPWPSDTQIWRFWHQNHVSFTTPYVFHTIHANEFAHSVAYTLRHKDVYMQGMRVPGQNNKIRHTLRIQNRRRRLGA